MTTSPRQANRILEEGQALALTSINKVTNRLELFGNLVVVTNMTTTAEPAGTNGAAYIGTGALTGTDWAGFTAGNILYYSDGWYEVPALEGMYVHDNDTNDLYYYNGAAWVALTSEVGHLSLAGGTMTCDITIDGNDIIGLSASNIKAGSFTIPDSAANFTFAFSDNGINTNLTVLGSSSTGTIEFDFLNLNASRRYTFPNLAGTLMLNLSEDATPQLGGELDLNSHTVGGAVQAFSSSSGTLTADWRLGNMAVITLSENIGTITWTAPTLPGTVHMKVIQDSTARTITWPASVEWPGGVAPVLSTTSGGVMWFDFRWDGASYWATGTTFS